MRLTNVKIRQSEFLFYVAYCVFLFSSILLESFYSMYIYFIDKPMALFCAGLLFCKELLCRAVNRKTIWGIGIMYLLAVWIVYRGGGTRQITFACTFLFAFGARDIDFKRICRITLAITGFLLVFIIASAYAGIIPNYHTDTAVRSRDYLGFRYALYAATLLANIVFLYVYIKDDRIKLVEIAGLFLVFWYIYRKTDSRLTFALAIATLLVALVYKWRKKRILKHKALPGLLVPSYIYASVLSIYLTVRYNPNVAWMAKINGILGRRLEYGRESITQFGIRLLGNPDIVWIGNGLTKEGETMVGTYLYVDNLYVQILQRYGVIFLIAYLALATIAMVRCYKKREYLLLVIMTIIAAHGVIDDLILYLHFNTFELLFGSAVFGLIRDRREPVRLQLRFEGPTVNVRTARRGSRSGGRAPSDPVAD